MRATVRRLEVFVLAVESRGFRACADKLRISQAAVSHHIESLEKELGLSLFIRRRGAAAGVTEMGIAVYRQARDLLAEAAKLESLGYSGENRKGRRLRVEADPLLDSHIARKIAKSIDVNSRFDISLKQSYFEKMVEDFNKGEVDLIYFYSDDEVFELNSTFCWHEPISICARYDHPLCRAGTVDVDRLPEYPFIAPPKGSHFRRSVDAILTRAGLSQYPVALEVDNASLAREAVINGFAISAVVSRYLDEDLQRFGVRPVTVRGMNLALQVRRAINPQLVLDRSVASLAECLDHPMPVTSDWHESHPIPA